MYKHREDSQTDSGEENMWLPHTVSQSTHGTPQHSHLCIKQEEARETQDYCESVLAGIIDSIQRHHMSVRELIRGHEEQAAAQAEISRQTLQGEMEEMRKRDAELDRLAQTDSDARFLQVLWSQLRWCDLNLYKRWCPNSLSSPILSSQGWLSMQHLCENDHLHPLQEDSENPLLPFEITKRAVGQLGEQLEEFCDRRFASICQTGMYLCWCGNL